MQTIMNFMIIEDGIHGEDLLKKVQRINLGYGQQEIMSLILLLRLEKHSPLNHTSIDTVFHIVLQTVQLPFGIQSSVHQHTSSFSPHIQRMESILPNISGLSRSL